MYVKIFENILDSSVWEEPHHTVRVWLALLCMASETGFVRAVDSAIRKRAGGSKPKSVVTAEEFADAMQTLQDPDLESHDQDYAGRRIERVEGGWQVLNYHKYREIRTKKQMQDAERQARYRREKKKKERDKTVTERDVTNVTTTETETESSKAGDPELALVVQEEGDPKGEEETAIVIRDQDSLDLWYDRLAARDWTIARPVNEAKVAWRFHRWRNNNNAPSTFKGKRERIAVSLIKDYGLVSVLLACEGQLTHPDKNQQDGRKYRTWDHLCQAENGPQNIEKCRDHAVSRGDLKYVLQWLSKLQQQRGWTPTELDRQMMDTIAPQQGGGDE